MKIQVKEIKSTIIVVIPLMAAFLAQRGMQLIDTVMLGWLGPHALAAAAIAIAIFMNVCIFCMGTLSAVGVFIAHAKGENDHENVKANMLHGLCLAGLLALLCMTILWFVPDILLKIGEQLIIVKNTTLLIHSLMWGIPGFLIFFTFREFVSTFSLTLIVLIVTLFSLPLTFVMNDILMYGRFGFPVLGIAGIGFAGSIVMWFMALCLFLYAKQKTQLRPYISVQGFQFQYRKIIEMMYIGVPSGLLLMLESSLFLSAAIMVSYFGVEALAAYQIVLQCSSAVYALPFSLAMATALRVSHAVGANDFPQARRLIAISFSLGFSITVFTAAFFIFCPNWLVKIFLHGNEPGFQQIQHLAVTFLLVAAIYQFSDTLQSIANGALRGLKDTLIPMLLCVSCYWFIGIGSSYYFAFHTHVGAVSVWYGITLGLLSTGIMLLLRLITQIKKTR